MHQLGSANQLVRPTCAHRHAQVVRPARPRLRPHLRLLRLSRAPATRLPDAYVDNPPTCLLRAPPALLLPALRSCPTPAYAPAQRLHAQPSACAPSPAPTHRVAATVTVLQYSTALSQSQYNPLYCDTNCPQPSLLQYNPAIQLSPLLCNTTQCIAIHFQPSSLFSLSCNTV